tara:strand:+ start:3865 stop:4254 length:390 start_codon:yes stop_codon:yes gene_type:complete
MRIVLDTEQDYTPEWEGNREESEPVVFRLRYLTTAERQRFSGLKAAASLISMGANGSSSVSPNVEIDFEGMFKAGVVGISGLNVRRRGKDTDDAITTPAAFLELPSFDGLFWEVVLEIQRANARQDPGN